MPKPGLRCGAELVLYEKAAVNMETTTIRNDLTEGVIWKKLLGFFFPILLGTLFQQLYNTVDAVIVGKFVGTLALAAVGGSAAQIINLVVGFFVGLSSGAMVIISQYYGAGDGERLSSAVHTAIAFSIVGGALLTVAGIAFAPQALRLVHNPEEIMTDSVLYLRIYFVGVIPLLLFNIGSGILRAVGDSRRPLYYLVICCILNIVLDILFVTVFHMGVAGVAWATVIALTVSALLIVLSLCLTVAPYQLRLENIRLHPAALRRMLYIGIPAGVQSAMYSLSNLIIQAAVNGLGTSVVAAWTTTGKLDGVFWSVSSSFGVAIMAFVGQAFGAGKYDRMKRSVRVCMGLALGSAAAISVLLLGLGKYCFRIFTDDALVIDYAVEMLSYFAPFYVVWIFIEVLSNTLRGAGDAIRPMIITIIGVCGLRVVWTLFVVPAWHTVMGISMCYPFTWIITALAFIIYYFKSDWLRCCTAASGQMETPS